MFCTRTITSGGVALHGRRCHRYGLQDVPGAVHRRAALSSSSPPEPEPLPQRRSGNDGNLHSDSLVSATTSYLTSLRLRALSALSASLSSREREEVLKKLKAVDEETAQEKAQRSIGEAVVAAVQKEAAVNESNWQREREKIELQAKHAAEERIRHELALAERKRGMKRWQKELEDEQSLVVTRQQEKERRDDAPSNDHPILGKQIIDLGYKRVHTVSAKALAAIPIWEKQRVYRHDRARAMASDKMKSLPIGFPGIISLHEDSDGQLSILDGQHRVGMFSILQEKITSGGENGDSTNISEIDLSEILVEVFPDRTPKEQSTHAKSIFLEINKAEPVKLVDLPGVAKRSDKRIIDGAAEALRTAFPDMFKPSQRCRPPHLNLDNLRDALFAADVLKRHSIKSEKSLVDWLMGKNSEMGSRFEGEGANGSRSASKSVSKSALAKAAKFKFFLGLDSSWLYQ